MEFKKNHKNVNEKSYLYLNVFVTDRVKANFRKESFPCFPLFMNNQTEWLT